MPMEQCPNKILVNSLIHLRSILIEEETLVLNPKNENKTTFKLLSKTFFFDICDTNYSRNYRCIFMITSVKFFQYCWKHRFSQNMTHDSKFAIKFTYLFLFNFPSVHCKVYVQLATFFIIVISTFPLKWFKVEFIFCLRFSHT